MISRVEEMSRTAWSIAALPQPVPAPPKLDLEPLFRQLAERAHLTERQEEVARLILQGTRDHDIAQWLGCSKNNVKDLARIVYRKFEVNSRGEFFACFFTIGRIWHDQTAKHAPGELTEEQGRKCR